MQWALQDARHPRRIRPIHKRPWNRYPRQRLYGNSGHPKVFGAHAESLLVSSTNRCMVTHWEQQARWRPSLRNGAAQSGCAAHGKLQLNADPACNLDVVRNEVTARQMETALSNSFAFGGLNAAMVLRAKIRPGCRLRLKGFFHATGAKPICSDAFRLLWSPVQTGNLASFSVLMLSTMRANVPSFSIRALTAGTGSLLMTGHPLTS